MVILFIYDISSAKCMLFGKQHNGRDLDLIELNDLIEVMMELYKIS